MTRQPEAHAPGSNQRDMKGFPVTLLAMVLASVPATALCMTNTWSLPGDPDASASAEMANFEPRSTAQPSPYEQELVPAHATAQTSTARSHSASCRHDMASGLAVDSDTTDRSCIDAADTPERFSVRLGHRLGAGSDILGQFDGVRMDYRASENLKLNGIAGYQALSAGDVFNASSQLYGISAEAESSSRNWDLGSYLIEQQVNGQLAGRSMGGAIRYLHPGRSMLVYLDYDIAGNSLGTLMTSGAWKLPFRTTVSATLDLQHRPIPARQQKYLQDSMTVTEGWNWILPMERLAYYTSDGSNQVSILAGSLSHALSRRIRLSGDVVMLDADADTASRSSEYFYHLKLTAKDLLVAGDHSKLDVRRSVTEDGETDTATLDNRFTIKRFWDLISQLRADYFSPDVESGSRWVASPRVKMEYRPSKHYGFHIEAGGNLSNGADPVSDSSHPSYYVSLGYQAKF
jgi:hypothetical protein